MQQLRKKNTRKKAGSGSCVKRNSSGVNVAESVVVDVKKHGKVKIKGTTKETKTPSLVERTLPRTTVSTYYPYTKKSPVIKPIPFRGETSFHTAEGDNMTEMERENLENIDKNLNSKQRCMLDSVNNMLRTKKDPCWGKC